MREILFRGKRTVNGEWFEGCLATFKDGDCAIFDPDDIETPLYQVDPKTVGQYTGLTDRNGKKIFEGDIVKQYPKDKMKNEFDVGEIIFYEEMGEFLLARDFDDFGICAYFDYVVIGNIYDNPELRVRTRNDNKFY